MFKRVIIAALLMLGMGVTAIVPASASIVTVRNGNFVGAVASGTTTPVPTPFGFGTQSYIDAFAWTASGCGCANAIASDPTQLTMPPLFAPLNPAGYSGNIYLADAAAPFHDGVYLQQIINGLTVGSRYTVSFLQASGSYYQTGGDTAQWLVGFGGSVSPYPNFVLSGATQQASALMTNPVGGFTGWTRQSATFTAGNSSELLSFFATGSGAPPFALLADVSISAVPEPATWAMMIFGFGVVGGAMRAAKRRSDAAFDAKIKRIAEGEIA